MGKRAVFLVASVVVGCLLTVTVCGDGKKGKDAAKSKAGQTSAGTGAAPARAEEAKPVVWEGEYVCKKGDKECRDDKSFGDGIFFGGTVFNTTVNADVRVRSEPSSKAGNETVLFTAKKDDKIQVLGVSKVGWTYVSVKDIVPKRGWISSEFVVYKEGEDLKKIKPTEMKITGFDLTAKDSSTADLVATYKIDGAESTMKFRAFKEKGQKFFTFIYDIYTDQSHYTIMPGLYAWEMAKNQLAHTAFLTRYPHTAGDGSALWEKAVFTDDKKFYIVTENENLMVFRTSDSKQLLAEVEVVALNMKNNTVKCACPADNVMKNYYTASEGAEMDNAISEYGDNYVNDNPQPANGDLSLKVICDVNLGTGARKITGAEWR